MSAWREFMAFIHWNDLFYVDPTTGEAFETGDEGLIPVPTYGAYGGAFHPEGELPTNGGAMYGSFNDLQAATLGTPALKPVDWSDYYYYVHDFEIRNADTPEEQAAADIKLITSLTFGDSSYANDPEATFYDGVATLGLIGRLAVNDQFDLLEDNPVLLTTALVDSAADIEYGLDNFSKKELNLALDTLFEPSGNKQFSLGFEITTQTFFEEVAEAAVINAAAFTLNESNDPRVNTISWPSIVGTSEYAFVYNVRSHDLDLISA
jgi:hypothetical protein